MEKTFICTKCGRDLPVDRFSSKKCRIGHSSICKDCHNTYVREIWYPKNQEKQRASSKKWKDNNRAAVLSQRYGIPVENICKIIEEADGKCQICGKVASLELDHDHKTGKARGMLCKQCNQGLWKFRDNEDSLIAAAKYINKAGSSSQA